MLDDNYDEEGMLHQPPKQMTQTTRAGTGGRSFDLEIEGPKTPSGGNSQAGSMLSQRERIDYEYLKNRDPMKEFFTLVSILPFLT